MSTKRTYGKAFAVPVQKRPFKPFPQNTAPMVLYRTPSQFNSLTNPPQGRIYPEKKNIDVEGSIGTVGTWSELDCLNAATAGAGANARIGRKTQLKSLLVRYNVSTAAQSTDVRILIVYDKQSDGLTPDITQILSGGATPTYNAPMNLSNSDRFVVLADEIDHTYAGGANAYSRSGKIYRKLNLPEHFNGTGGAFSDISSGAIWIMCSVSSGGGGAGIGYYSRIRFTDV